MSSILVPIIVLNWNGIEHTIECVEAIQNQTYKNWKIILVDNGSNKKNVLQLKKLYLSENKIELLLLKENHGFTKAHNMVFKQFILKKDYPYVALLNNDTLASPSWLEEILNFSIIEKSKITSSKMISYYHPEIIDNTGHLILNTGEIVPRNFSNDITYSKIKKKNIGSCAGATLYSTETLKKIGIFDNYFTTGYEDAELGLRAFLCGESTKYCKNAIVKHKMGKSIEKVKNEQYIIYIQQCIFYTFFKLMPKSILIFNTPFIIFKYTCVIMINIIFFRFVPLKTVIEVIYKSWTERKIIKDARDHFYSNHPIEKTFFEIQSNMTFFLLFDLKRFVKYIILNNKSSLEK
jgi:GT2 family glycosyltransferase